MTEIILASQSPRRSYLLEQAGIPFRKIIRPVEETWPAGMEVTKVPEHIALKKAQAVKEAIWDDKKEIRSPIVAADTVVLLDGTIIGKPADRAAAIETLLALSGKTHRVVTGVVILYKEEEFSFSETTEVDFYELTTEDAIYYTDRFKPFDKAGAYAIQEWIGITGIRAIRGDFYNVMGLPVSRLLRILKNMEL
jgi:septum formation protein